MADKIDQAIQNMIANLEEKTGRSLDEWVAIAQKSELDKVGARIKYLKSEYGLTHGYANLVALTAKDRETAAGEEAVEDPVEALFSGPKAGLRPVFDRILTEVKKFGPDLVESPKRTYVSLRRSKQFAIVQPSTKTRVDVGLVLKDRDPEGRLEAAGSWNSMCTHRVRLESPEDADKELFKWLKEAFDAA